MRILATADLHYNLRQFDWLLKEAPAYDMVVIAGDLLNVGGHADLDSQILVVGKYLERLRALVPVLVCSGNHDGDARNEHNEWVAEWLQDAAGKNLFVDYQTARFGNDLFTVCPWWDGPVTRGSFVEWIEAQRDEPRARWIWIHHAPPQDSPLSWTHKKFAGDEGLNKLMLDLRPDFVISGHIHNAPFSPEGSWIERRDGAWAFNAGSMIGDAPPHVILDLTAMTATWVSHQGVREMSLEQR